VVAGAVAEAAPTTGTGQRVTPTAAPVVGSFAWPRTPDRPSTTLQADFTAAAAEFHVPASVLLAVSYEETRWESHGGRPSVTGNYNVMGLTEVSPGDLAAPASVPIPASAPAPGGSEAGAQAQSSASALAAQQAVDTASPALHTLQSAAALTQVAVSRLKTKMRQSVRGGAALLASYEQRLRPSPGAPGRVPQDAAQWWPAVVAYAQAETPAGGRQFAARVYSLIEHGASRVTDDNQAVRLVAQPRVRPKELAAAIPTAAAECPAGLACSVVPAAYQPMTQGSSDYGDYARAHRPADGDQIQYLVLHGTGGSLTGTEVAFQDPATQASANYLIGRDGSVIQMVPTADIAWHTGNASLDAHSIGIAQEGYTLRYGSWYPESEYESSAALVAYLAARFDVPLDRQHLLGDDDVPAPAAGASAGTQRDPGPHWDWSRLLTLVGTPLTGTHSRPVVGGTVTVAPPYSRATQPRITGCGGTGRACPSHPADFLYLRADHSADAPLIGDGGTDSWDQADKAVYGQIFVVAGVYQDWVSIWYGGQQAWFEDPDWSDTLVPDAATSATLTLVAPTGSQPIPVYGRAYPETSAYPAALATSPQQQLTPLSGTIAPDQAYLAGAEVSGDYYAQDYDCSGPVGCRVVIGTTQYYPIRFDHGLAFVRASDVQMIAPAH
jgi:hypothetical protein